MITLHPSVSNNYQLVTTGADALTSLSHSLQGNQQFTNIYPQLEYYATTPNELFSATSSSLGVPIIILSNRGSKKRKHKEWTRYFPELSPVVNNILTSYIPSGQISSNPIVLYYNKGLYYALSRKYRKKRGCCAPEGMVMEERKRHFPYRSPFMIPKHVSPEEDLACAVQIMS